MTLMAHEFEVLEELRSFIPSLQPEEIALLRDSIAVEGCRDPLVVWQADAATVEGMGYGRCKECKDGNYVPSDEWEAGSDAWQCSDCGYGVAPYIKVLIDGHNRFAICKELGVDFSVVDSDAELGSIDDVKVWMIDNQMGKRNLADIDRIALQSKRHEILAAKAKENLKIPTGGRSLTSAKLPESKTPVDTRAECAKSAGVGERTYDAGRKILKAAEEGRIDQSEVDAIRRKEKSIHRVAKDLKEREQKEKRDKQRKEAVAKIKPELFDNIHVGDFRDNFDHVEDNSLSLIFTDPPYDRKASELYTDIGRFAAEKLCDGGSLLIYAGTLQLPVAFSELSKSLRYWWTTCCLHSGGDLLIKEYGIRNGWKAVLWFVKNSRADKEDIVRDVVSGGREKSHHDWQQSQHEAEYWIDHLCPPDGIVCDPFLGGGTTAAAAIKLGRKWIGYEKDHDQACLAVARLKQ